MAESVVSASAQLLTVKQAAERLSMSEKALRWHVHNGTAPRSALVAGRRKFREHDIDAFITAAFDESET